MSSTFLSSNLIGNLAKYSPAPLKNWARRQLKYQHERWASHLLLTKLQYTYLKLELGNPQNHQPDIIAHTDSAELGIEVTTIYYDQDQAKETWDKIKGQLNPDSSTPTKQKTDHLFIYNIQQAIDRKSAKNYQSNGPTWLCLVQLESFQSSWLPQELIKSLDTSQSTSFQRIYLLYPSLPDQWQLATIKNG